ncbi:MAG: type II CRISPR RNA-guided endonuclease Cas9, partial [Akkermansiaceae bacterium]
MSKKTKTLSFDIGHSSIGWAVLSSEKKTTDNPFPTPSIEGCGSVIFPKDDCLASSRRTFRRMRRNIRSTRLRITRLKQLLAHLQVLTPAELETPGHPAPHVLAARALLTDSPTLSWLELWHVLRWYAHNRGYDGNSRWSRQENDDEGDTDKEKAALQLMKEHGIDQKTGSMAETICATLGIKPLEAKPTKDGLKGHKGLSSQMPYKNNNAAFPRNIVRNEVLAILQKHQDHLPKLNQDFIDTLIAPEGKKEQQAWSIIKVPAIKLPRRYFGGLLFGQLIPRFDNRIIAKCPISGGKVPNKASVKFLRYRWAMLIANIKADGKPLTSEQRKSVDLLMKEKGRLTPTELREHVEKITGTKKTNIKASFEIHPDSKDALELDPALSFYRKAFNKPTAKSTGINLYWAHLPEITQKRALGRWKKKRPVNLQWMLDQCDKEKHDSTALTAAIDKFFTKDQKKKKPTFLTRDHLLRKNFAPDSRKLSGRAPYSRQVMDKVVHFVLNTDRHPTEKRTDTLEAGPIYRSPEVLKSERERPIDDLTNNHLLRQRLSILSRLTDHLIENYANNHAAQITDIVVEVASDLQTYSGLTAKEMAGELTKRLSHFKDAVKYLEENAPDMKLTGSLIRKCRIAMDLDWHCPFTGEGPYDPYELSKLELEHIIPYADRPTNALDALVLTWPEVNRMKGKRTAYQFIKEDGGKAVPGSKRLSIMVLNNFGSHTDPKKGFVGKLKTAVKKNYPDDYRRQSARKKWLMVEHYEAKDHGFTQGALTQTSHLNRLAFRQLEKRFTPENANKPTARITSIPGQVTAETRKGWRLLHTLNVACPVCTDKNKTEIRKLTHLHHALDAATLALTHHYLPGTLPGQNENEKGKVWKALLDRNKTKEQINLLMRT